MKSKIFLNKNNSSSTPGASDGDQVSFRSVLIKSMDERDYNSTASQSVVIYNVKESNDDGKVVTDLMNKLNVPSSYVKRSTRLGRKRTLPESLPKRNYLFRQTET